MSQCHRYGLKAILFFCFFPKVSYECLQDLHKEVQQEELVSEVAETQGKERHVRKNFAGKNKQQNIINAFPCWSIFNLNFNSGVQSF